MQKFSVLAYDYIDRIDNISKRELELEIQIKHQQLRVSELKSIALE